MDGGTLHTFVQQQRATFTQRLGKDFDIKRRATDFRQVFTAAVRSKFPTLPVPWLHKHNQIAKTLFSTYNPELLRQMIALYLSREEYYTTRGVSVEGFYWLSQKLATDIAIAKVREKVIAERKRLNPQDEDFGERANLPRQGADLRRESESRTGEPAGSGQGECLPPLSEPSQAEIETLKESAFFKKLPAIFQEKIRAEAK